MKLREYMNESIKNNKIYFHGSTLWVAYAPNSGSTIKMIKDTYITDKSNDSHFDSNTNDIKKFANKNKPLKKKSNSKLFEIPVYHHMDNQNDFDIWGGFVKPFIKKYMIVNNNKITVVNFFTKKGEAISWMKSTL